MPHLQLTIKDKSAFLRRFWTKMQPVFLLSLSFIFIDNVSDLFNWALLFFTPPERKKSIESLLCLEKKHKASFENERCDRRKKQEEVIHGHFFSNKQCTFS